MGGVSSEAAKKAYPKNDWTATEGWLMRAAFDRGAVEALRQAADRCANWHLSVGADDHGMTGWLRDMADEWAVGQ